jgi:hypothetical protein
MEERPKNNVHPSIFNDDEKDKDLIEENAQVLNMICFQGKPYCTYLNK